MCKIVPDIAVCVLLHAQGSLYFLLSHALMCNGYDVLLCAHTYIPVQIQLSDALVDELVDEIVMPKPPT